MGEFEPEPAINSGRLNLHLVAEKRMNKGLIQIRAGRSATTREAQSASWLSLGQYMSNLQSDVGKVKDAMNLMAMRC